MSSTSILSSRSPYVLGAGDPVGRRVGTWLCDALQISPHSVAEVRHVYDFARNLHVFEFIGWHHGPGLVDTPWEFEVGASLPISRHHHGKVILSSHFISDEELAALGAVPGAP